MKLLILLFLSGCQTIIYTQACPKDDVKCQTNQDAELLHMLKQKEAAVMLLCGLPQYQSVLDCPAQD
tara:strand:+ start:1411 stop:1611 length:201 start_codon:yes stop_codon:yes gene_type:complete